MQKVILNKTKKVIDVLNNKAHYLIENGLAKLYKPKNKFKKTNKKVYKHRAMKAEIK